MIVVANATCYTVELLMAQSLATGMHDYSTLSSAIGGRWYKVIASVKLYIVKPMRARS